MVVFMEWELYKGDCFEHLPKIKDKSVDMILCDLPYGTTACKWDTPLDLERLWREYKRVIKEDGAIVLTANQPFTTCLISSNYEMFKYVWVWNKKGTSTAFLAKIQPLRQHEDIVVFGKKPRYYPIMVKGKPRVDTKRKAKNGEAFGGKIVDRAYNNPQGLYYPKTILTISNADHTKKIHPTQKPVALFEYLIKTYTNEGDLVLDNCAGSGTTGVACMNLNRDCIMMELEDEYCDIILKRMAENDQQKLI